MVVGKDTSSQRPVRNYEPHFPVRAEFQGANYLERYRILCQKLILERHYTSAALLWTSEDKSYGNIAEDISLLHFINSFKSYLNGLIDDF